MGRKTDFPPGDVVGTAVYEVKRDWTDYDGWSKGSERSLGMFSTREKAEDCIEQATGKRPQNGYLSLPSAIGGRGDRNVYTIKEHEVK